MSKDAFEQLLVSHCAPTFAGIKAANLISLPLASYRQCKAWLRQYAPVFSQRGIYFMFLSVGVRHVLLLIYREKELTHALSRPAARSVLANYSYPKHADLQELLAHLSQRCQAGDGFPHEIGLFLDYPPADVQGFITHHGHDFRYAGYWKIYVNEAVTRALFDRFTACTKTFCSRLSHGVPMTDLLAVV